MYLDFNVRIPIRSFGKGSVSVDRVWLAALKHRRFKAIKCFSALVLCLRTCWRRVIQGVRFRYLKRRQINQPSRETFHLSRLLDGPLVDVDLEPTDAPRSGQNSDLCCLLQLGLPLDLLLCKTWRLSARRVSAISGWVNVNNFKCCIPRCILPSLALDVVSPGRVCAGQGATCRNRLHRAVCVHLWRTECGSTALLVVLGNRS